MIRKLLPYLLIATTLEGAFGGMLLGVRLGFWTWDSWPGLIGYVGHLFPGGLVGAAFGALGFPREYSAVPVCLSQFLFWFWFPQFIAGLRQSKLVKKSQPAPRIRDLEN